LILRFATKDAPTAINSVPPASDLKAWKQNGFLHIKGLIVGQFWSIYNASGQLIRQTLAQSGEVKIKLPESGVYIITTGHKKIKVK